MVRSLVGTDWGKLMPSAVVSKREVEAQALMLVRIALSLSLVITHLSKARLAASTYLSLALLA
jgi:hypothetical protein